TDRRCRSPRSRKSPTGSTDRSGSVAPYMSVLTPRLTPTASTRTGSCSLLRRRRADEAAVNIASGYGDRYDDHENRRGHGDGARCDAVVFRAVRAVRAVRADGAVR